MLEVFDVVSFISDICGILSFVLLAYSVVRDAKERAKPSAPPDGFDTSCDSQESDSIL